MISWELNLAFDLCPRSCNYKLTNDKHFDSCLPFLISYYGEEITDNFQGVVTLSIPVIDKVAIKSEKEGFKKEMLFSKVTFDIGKIKTSQQLLHEGKRGEAKKTSLNELQMILERKAKEWILH